MQQTTKVNFLINSMQPQEVFTPEQFSDEQKMLDEMVRKFVYQSIRPKLENIEAKQFEYSKAFIKEAADLGLIAADILEKDGGLELGKVSAAIIAERMADTRSFSITFGGQTGIGALPIAYFGNEKQKNKYLPSILSGEKITAYALTEPSSGTDALGALTTATLSEDGKYYILSGEKQWISNAGFADYFIVYVKVDRQHFTCFIVERQYEGVKIGTEEKKMGLHGSSTCSVILDQVKVPVENVLGEIGKGHVIAFNVLNIGRQKIASSSLGTMKRVLEISSQYANTRKQFKQSIAQFGLIQQKLAQMASYIYVNESAIYRTAGAMEEAFVQEDIDYGSIIAQFALESSIIKVTSTEFQDFVVDEGLQIHGGYGYMEEYEIETLFRDARISRIFEGTNEINRIIIATSILKMNLNVIEETAATYEQQVLQTLKVLLGHVHRLAIAKGYTNASVEQEVATVIANIASAIYVLQSAILRTERYRTPLKELYTIMYANEVAKQMFNEFSNIALYIGADEQAMKTAQKLLVQSPVCIVEAKRKIALEISKAEKYIV